jgi:hypothetical protein
MSDSKFDRWLTSVDLWKTGAVVTHFMRDEIARLRDADGDLLPEAVRSFLADLVFCKIKPRKGRPIAKSAVRDSFEVRRFAEQLKAGPGTPAERAIESIAVELKLSERTVSSIVYPRKTHKSTELSRHKKRE